jgi:hypothetical protein
MSTLELKESIINKIQDTTDQNILEGISRIFDLNLDNSDIYVLNDVQKSKIKIAREQIKNGEFFTEEQADMEFEKWLKK